METWTNPVTGEEMTMERLIARGKYATVVREIRLGQKILQELIQKLTDEARAALQAPNEGITRLRHLETVSRNFEDSLDISNELAKLTGIRDALSNAAWGNPDADNPLNEVDPI